MRWFRVYDDIINDPKLLKLPDATRWHWLAVLCVASKCEGKLPPLDDLALHLRVPAAKATAILIDLQKAGLIDKTETGFVPHNWAGRQYKSDVSTERVKRFRNGERNVSVKQDETVSETPPETENRIQITEKKETRAGALWPVDYADRFWTRYPNKVGKPAALAKLETIRKRGVAFDAIMAGLERYIAGKPADRAWLNPLTFLNQERWEDQPAKPDQTSLAPSIGDEMPIEEAVKLFSRMGHWSRNACSPAPGEPGCKASVELLAKYGLREDGRKLEHETSH